MGSIFRKVQVVLVKENREIWGATHFEDCVFMDCELCDITLLMNRPTYRDICDKSPDFGRFIPVISEDAMFASVNSL
jgi:hypothetical protein